MTSTYAPFWLMLTKLVVDKCIPVTQLLLFYLGLIFSYTKQNFDLFSAQKNTDLWWSQQHWLECRRYVFSLTGSNNRRTLLDFFLTGISKLHFSHAWNATAILWNPVAKRAGVLPKGYKDKPALCPVIYSPECYWKEATRFSLECSSVTTPNKPENIRANPK